MALTGAEYFFRAYSDSSDGSLVSGYGRKAQPASWERNLPRTVLLDEFDKHRNLYNRDSTVLVSVSDRIIDTLCRAFNKFYKDGEPPEEIWIAIIRVPPRDATDVVCHAAQDLVREIQLGDDELLKFRHEFLFEWEVPKAYIVHQVSVKTLIDRRLDMKEYLCSDQHCIPPTGLLRNLMRMDLEPSPMPDYYHLGIDLGIWGCAFGARAPTSYIARQVFRDCFGGPLAAYYDVGGGIDWAIEASIDKNMDSWAFYDRCKKEELVDLVGYFGDVYADKVASGVDAATAKEEVGAMEEERIQELEEEYEVWAIELGL